MFVMGSLMVGEVIRSVEACKYSSLCLSPIKVVDRNCLCMFSGSKVNKEWVIKSQTTYNLYSKIWGFYVYYLDIWDMVCHEDKVMLL